MGIYTLSGTGDCSSFLVLVRATSQLEAIRKVIAFYRERGFVVEELGFGQVKIGGKTLKVSAFPMPLIV